MRTKPEICVLRTDGTNCDDEMYYAFEQAGANSQLVHINQIRSGEKSLGKFAGLGIPGGFTYGDDIASGTVLANELKSYLQEDMQKLVEQKKPILGVCNGFQVLARTGLLPYRELGNQSITLTQNTVGHFVCKWVDLETKDSICIYAQPYEFDGTIPMQIAHGEGRFVSGNYGLRQLQDNKQVVFTYENNPNGSEGNIAGICDTTGVVLGMMPHPERSISAFHPNRAQTSKAKGAAQTILNNFVNYAREL